MSKKRRIRRRTSRKELNDSGFPIVAAIVFVFCLALGVYSYNLKTQSRLLEERKNDLEAQIAQEEERAKELEEFEKYTKTKKYMEEVARERLGLVYPDEILVQPTNK